MTTITTSIYRRLFHITMLLLVLFGSVTLSSAAPLREQTPSDALSALKASLTPEQQQAIKAVFQKYEPELAAIIKEAPTPAVLPRNEQAKPMLYLPFVGNSNSQASAPIIQTQTNPDTSTIKQFQTIIDRVESVRAKMEQEFATILTPDQLAIYHAGLSGGSASTTQAHTTQDTPLTTAAKVQNINLGSCGVAALNATAAYRNANQANTYAFIAAFDLNYPFTGAASEIAAFQNLNGAQRSALSAQQNLSAAYFEISIYGNDLDNVGFYGQGDVVRARDYALAGFGAYTVDDYNLNYFVRVAFISGYNSYIYSRDAAIASVGCH